MAGYVTRFEFDDSDRFPKEMVPIELAMASARESRTRLLAFWFASSYRDLVAVWDAATEQAVHAIVAEVTQLGGITGKTVRVFTDEELAQQIVLPDLSSVASLAQPDESSSERDTLFSR